MRRVGIFGWGVVAPRSPNIEVFAHNLESSESWLETFKEFGPSNFLVGLPEWSLENYRAWIEERFGQSRFMEIRAKRGPTTHYAIGAFIQALEQNPGLEQALQELETQAHVYVGTVLGDIGIIYKEALRLHRAQRRWDRFWASPERNSALREYEALPEADRGLRDDVPPSREDFDDPEDREEAEERWLHYWAERSPELMAYLEELRKIQSVDISGDVETNTFTTLTEKRRQYLKLKKRWNAPDPPWEAVSADVAWNINTTPAAQISMLGRITGMCFAPVGACATFGMALKLAMDAIHSGMARAVVIGATDPPPHPLVVGSLYKAGVMSADASVSKPLTGMRGTHVAGGSVVWIVGDWDFFIDKGFRPLGMEPLAVGVSADADQIIKPSTEGPVTAIRQALDLAGVTPGDLGTWDLHATATPGDYAEMTNLRRVVPDQVWITARKGTFGHGLGVSGGWELTAQCLGVERGQVYPTAFTPNELNEEIARVHKHFVFSSGLPGPTGLAGKMSMGIGGINSCVILRPLGG